jgi:hypothetical protein
MNTIEKKSVKAGNYVSKNEMNALTTAYKQDRWAANTERLGRADSLSLWYTVEELENFLNEVKVNGGNGVRIHFGVFPEGYRKPELVGMQTVVLVANRSKDETLQNAKELRGKNGEIIAMDGPVPCPPYCGIGVGDLASSMGQSTIIVRDGNMEVI